METTIRLLFFIGILLSLALWEYFLPKRKLSQPKLRRWPANLGMVILNTVLTRAIFGITLFAVGLFGEAKGWGIFRWMGLPPWVNFIFGILVLDFAVWLQHYLFHRINLIWPIHRMHHTDLDFDVTTGIRFHPAEIIPSTFYKAGIVLLFGINPWPAAIFEVLLNAFSQFTHANVKMPPRFEKIFRFVFVTPDMHRVHHSTDRREHNQNFGFCFSLWDRICHTYLAQPSLPHETMEIGVKDFRDPKRLGFWRLLGQPFRN
jgi:sterol desaturase/sphingolipid hydroxylase (fatty acid hydroxylase superfamily)